MPAPNDLVLAMSLADLADVITLSAFRSRGLKVETKPDQTPVTEADRAVEERLRAELATTRPDDSIVGEEYGGTDVTGRRWIIDPIDGTKNFLRGVPVWATLVALADDGGVRVGVVSAPALGRRWWAERGAGAWTQGPEDVRPRRLAVSAVAALADASFSYSDPVGWPAGAVEHLSGESWRVRAYGDFWSHLLVAEGCVDVAAEPELSIWDVAALIPIVEEAGGRITGFDGGAATSSAVTTNGLLHEAVLGIVRGG
jgi:histidinol-phosphatase